VTLLYIEAMYQKGGVGRDFKSYKELLWSVFLVRVHVVAVAEIELIRRRGTSFIL